MKTPHEYPYSAAIVYRQLQDEGSLTSDMLDEGALAPDLLVDRAAAGRRGLQLMAEGFAHFMQAQQMPVDHIEEHLHTRPQEERAGGDRPYAIVEHPAWIVVQDANLSGEPLTRVHNVFKTYDHGPSHDAKIMTVEELEVATDITPGSDLSLGEDVIAITTLGEILSAGRSWSGEAGTDTLARLRAQNFKLDENSRFRSGKLHRATEALYPRKILEAMAARLDTSRAHYQGQLEQEAVTGRIDRPSNYYFTREVPAPNPPAAISAPATEGRRLPWKS